MISVVCEAFGCTPSEALAQDPALVRAILDYRRLVRFEANREAETIDYDELTFYEEVRALGLEDGHR